MTTAREAALASLRYVRPDTLRVSDLIRVKWSVEDVECSRVAKIGYIETLGHYTEVRSLNGVILFSFDSVNNITINPGDGNTPHVVITLINRTPINDISLF